MADQSVNQAIQFTPVATSQDVMKDALPDRVSIPADFIRVLCCAFTCNNTQTPDCYGCKDDSLCLCTESSTVNCKMMENDPVTCCILSSGFSECVRPTEFMRCYKQFFCFECYGALPMTEDGYRVPAVRLEPVHPRHRPNQDVCVCCAACFSTCSFNCMFPGCLSCYSLSEQLCFHNEMVANKFLCCGDPPKRTEGSLCLLSGGSSSIIYPKTCCRGITRYGCVDCRTTFPYCDEEIPCVCGVFPNCYYCVDWKFHCTCCLNLGDAMNRNAAKNPPAAHQAPQQAQPQQVSAPSASTPAYAPAPQVAYPISENQVELVGVEKTNV